jgi:hypothetical protein
MSRPEFSIAEGKKAYCHHGNIIYAEFLIQVIGECDRAVVLRMAVPPGGKEGIIGTPRSRVNERIIPAGIPHITTGLPVICRKYGGIVTRSAGPLVTR